MTLEEGMHAAKKGNVNAMMSVARYYADNHKPMEALEYAEMAGQKGLGDGMLMAMLLRSIAASTARSLPAWDDVINHCEKMFYWSKYILNLGNTSDADLFSQKDYDLAYTYALQALYIGGMAHYFKKEFREAVNASEGKENALLQILHAISLFQLASTDSELRQVNEELEILTNEEFSTEDLDKYDDIIIGTGAQTQALLYRSGVTGKEELTCAHQVLVTAFNLVKSPTAKAKLSSEMSHYHMSKLGNFTYV